MISFSCAAYTVLHLPDYNEIGVKKFLNSIIESICDSVARKDGVMLRDVSIEFLADKDLYCELMYEYHSCPGFVKHSTSLFGFEDFGFRFVASPYFGDFGPIVFPGIPFTVKIMK